MIMNKEELRNKIKDLVVKVYKDKTKANQVAEEYDELTKFPELKKVIVDLLTIDFDSFLSSIEWVAPRPTTFRINLKNNENFYLIWNQKSWIAQVKGKKYYLLNLPEEERAALAISRILRYGERTEGGEGADVDNAEDLGLDEPVDDTEELGDAGEE